MKHHLFIVAALTAVLLASCSGEDELSQKSYPVDNQVRIKASVNSVQALSGYTGSTLENFGLSIINPVNSRTTFQNVEVEKSESDGSWVPKEQLRWNNLTDTLDIVACAPYSKDAYYFIGIGDYKVSVEKDQSDADNYNASDFMVFYKLAFIPEKDLESDGTLGIEFEHYMSQLNITVEFSKQREQKDYYTSNPIHRLKVCGAKINGECNFTVTPHTVTATGSQETILALESADFEAETATTPAKAHYSCILIPQSFEPNKFAIELETNNGTVQRVASYSVDLKKGKAYEINLSY